jgi:hypothetical protein
MPGDDAAVERLLASRAEQGLPVGVVDPVVVERIVAMLRPAVAGTKKCRRRSAA